MWCPKCLRETDIICETSCNFFILLDAGIEFEELEDEEEWDELQDN